MSLLVVIFIFCNSIGQQFRADGILFPPLRQALSVVRQCKKPTRKWHIWFLPTHKPMLKKPKEPFFPTLDKQN